MPIGLFKAKLEQSKKSQYDAYWRMGQICSVTANIHRGKGSKIFKPEDFMPARLTGDNGTTATNKQSQPATAKQLKDQIRGLNKVFAGRLAKPKKKEPAK